MEHSIGSTQIIHCTSSTGTLQFQRPCWSPDNKTLYFSDSLKYHIYAYDYDVSTGDVANRRLFADTRELGEIRTAQPSTQTA